MSQSKLSDGQYSLLLLALKATHTNFMRLNIISCFMLKLKQTSNIRCRPMALGARRQMSSAYITLFMHCSLI